MNFHENCLLFMKIESEADSELENYELGSSEGCCSETLSNLIDTVSEKICDCLYEVHEHRDLFDILSHYTRKLYVYNEYSNSVVLVDDTLRPHIIFLLKKYWLVVNGVLKRIDLTIVNQEIEMLFEDDYSTLSIEKLLDNLYHIYIPIFFFRGIKLSSLLINKLFRVEMNLFQELSLALKYKTIQHLYNSLFSNCRLLSSKEKDTEKFRSNMPNIGSEIATLKSIQDRTSAMLNIISYKNDDSSIGNELKSDVCDYLLKIWDEYRKLGIEEDFIAQILKSRYLPSKDIKCQIIFTLLFHIKQLDIFEDLLRQSLENSFNDYSIAYLIYYKWKSIFVDKDTNESKNKKCHFYSLEELRVFMWNNYIIKLISKKDNYFYKIQGTLLACCFLSEVIQYSIELSNEERKIIMDVLFLLFEDINEYIESKDLFESKLERSILPGSLNTEFMISLNKFVITIKCVANINFESVETAKSIFYQLASIVLCDDFMFKKFICHTILFDYYERYFLKLTKTEHLFQVDLFNNYIFLFGSIPIQVITSGMKSTSEIILDFGSIFGFSLRKFEPSIHYNNSINLVQLLEDTIHQINIRKKENIKNLILIYIDLLKRFSQYLVNIKIITRSKNYIKFSDLDSFYSYIILFTHLNYCFKNNLPDLNEHTIRSFNSLPKPKYGQDEILF
ncbi:hypothetical protein RS030_4670 [Cryptosporidium xiaoi]|uniref:Uncharacterized protein n=1 Tax=Cryptosporidium xiaoi TaxID=659607 RepID=A0AAV9XW71_9CRYT